MDDPGTGRRSFHLDDRLIDMPERNQGLSWPLAVDLWLEQQVARARRIGMTTSRKELAAALTSQIEPDDDALASIITRYRRRTGRDLLHAEASDPNVVTFPRHRPGPRRQAEH